MIPILLASLLAVPAEESTTPRPFDGWHESFEEARDAAAVSGRPILLFELFGRLDEERC
ncbi:MAG: hypothetical protein AAF957_17065 [Planctomycetota bacterium]